MRLFFTVLFIFLASMANAATPGQPAYKHLVMQAGYPWNEGFFIRFEPDEKLCRKVYGAQWREKCSASPGRYGNTAKGIEMTPKAPGYWQWNGGETLQFIPENGKSIKPDTTYHVNLDKLFVPSFVKLDARKLSAHTLPLSVNMQAIDFWTDPSPAAEHRLAGSFTFNYPVEDKPHIEAIVPAGAIFGDAEMVWNADRDRLNISWPVKKLPDSMSQAGILFKHFGQISEKDGIYRYWAANPKIGGTLFHKNMPGKNGLFHIKNAVISQKLNDNLDRVYVLEIETSLYARQKDIQKNLTVRELPVFNSPEGAVPYNWIAAPAVPASVLKKCPALQLVPMQTDNAPRSKFQFVINAKPGNYVLCAISQGLMSASSEKLGKSWSEILRAEKGDAYLDFMQPGNVLPLAGDGILDIYAMGLDELKYEAQMVRDPFMALLAVASCNSFAAPFGNMWPGIDSFSAARSGTISLPQPKEGKAQFGTLDLGSLLPELAREAANGSKSSGLVLVDMKGFHKGKEVAAAHKFILATDLGIVVKRNAGGALDCFAQNIISGKPVGNAALQILGANGKAVAQAQTDNEGHAAFPVLTGLSRESKPVAVMAEHNGNIAWLSLKDSSRELNYSEYSTGGAHTDSRGINVFLFSQRGIYRPGDTMYFGAITRMADFSPVPADLPLYAEILDPRGVKVWDKIFKAGQYGVSQQQWTPGENALSGKYTLNIRAARDGEVLGSVAARLEEFQPETLRLKIELPAIKGWLRTNNKDSTRIELAMQNLYGFPAQNHKIKTMLETKPALFRFEDYSDYIFMDAAPASGNGQRRQLQECMTDNDGNASVTLPDDILGHASTLVTLLAEGFEASGGRATTAHASFLASPLDFILGYKPFGSLTNLDYVMQNSKAELDFMALNPGLERVELKNVEFSVAHKRYVTSLVSDGQGGFHYDETPFNQTLKKWKADIPQQGAKVALDTENPGEFLLMAHDSAGRMLACVPYAVAGEKLEAPGTPLAGGKMRMRLDRKHYKAGDTINIALSLPYAGSGLLTLERSGVEAFAWFQAKAGDSIWQLRVPENFEGKGYIVASFARSVDSPEIYMSPYTFAIESFMANMAVRDMALKMDAPKQIKPGSELKIKISSAQKGKAIIYAVDEGILQLTNYQMPKPLNYLLGDRALDVRTLQALDLLMPTHARLRPRLSAFGGGMDSLPFGARFQNPFKRRNEPPVAQWFSIVDTGPDARELSLAIPGYYNGRIRLMAVGASETTAGDASMETVSVSQLVLTPQTPLNVAPGDEFEGALIVANTDKIAFDLKLSLDAGKAFKIIKPMPETVNIPAGKEIVCPFILRALDNPGPAKIVFAADDGKLKLARNAELAIRPASPLETSVMSGRAAKSQDIVVPRQVYPEQAGSVASISALPLPLANGLVQYLDAYPYGCTEQLISRSFAHLLLEKWLPEFVNSKAGQKLLDATLGAIRSRFNGNGVSLWPDSESNLLLTAYAGDFLLALRESGNGAGDELLQKICEALNDNCSLNESSLEAARASAYAIWVLTREGRVTTQLLEDLLDSLRERGVPGWQTDITAALIAASQKEMHINKTIPMQAMSYNPAGWFDEYAQYALHTAILARYFPEKCTDDLRNDFYEATVLAMNKGNYATFSASQGIRALMRIGSSLATDVLTARIACSENGGSDKTRMLANGAMFNYSTNICSTWKLDIPAGSPELFWQIATTGYDRKAAAKSVSHGIVVEKSYLDAAGNEVLSPANGDVLTVRITARAESGNISDCAITDLLPGGFEMYVSSKTSQAQLPPGMKFVNRMEDRMLLFADLRNDPMTFTYKIRAVSPGKFVVPPTYAQSMYNQSVYGHNACGEMEIIK